MYIDEQELVEEIIQLLRHKQAKILGLLREKNPFPMSLEMIELSATISAYNDAIQAIRNAYLKYEV